MAKIQPAPQTIAQRVAVTYRINNAVMSAFYVLYGLNFLLFANRTSVVIYGGLIASPVFWGIAFIVVGALVGQSLLMPGQRKLYQISRSALIGLTIAWCITRTVVSISTGRDLVVPLLWVVLLIGDLTRLYFTNDLPDIPLPPGLTRLVQRVRGGEGHG